MYCKKQFAIMFFERNNVCNTYLLHERIDQKKGGIVDKLVQYCDI